MSRGWSRREVLAAASAAWIAGNRPARAFSFAGVGIAANRTRRRDDPLEQLAARLIAAPREQALSIAEPLLRDGLSWQELLGAVFLAGIREIRPRPVGFKLHAVMVVESVFQLAERSPRAQALHAVLWNLDDFKLSQARDVEEGDWSLPDAPEVEASSAESAAGELARALDSGDDERADRAVVAAHAALPLDELFERLWPFAIRDFTNLGHEPIFATHVARVLARLQGRAAQPALRALVHGLLAGGGAVDDFRASVELAPRLRDGWMEGERDPERSLALALAIRPSSAAAAREAVVAELNEGLDPASVWDALRLVAADLFARRPGLLPVHPTTVTSALHHVFRVARGDETRRLAILQAASWLPRFREALAPRTGLSMEPGGIDPLVELARDPVALEPVTPEALFAEPTRERAVVALSRPGALPAFAALLEDSLTADPRWHPVLLASALDYLPSAATPATPFHQRACEVVDRVDGSRC